MAKIRHVAGNAFRLGISLKKRVEQFVDGVHTTNDAPLLPLLAGAPIRVVFSKGKRFNYEYDGHLEDGYVVVEDKGTLPIGSYSITVLATDNNGDPLRYKDKLVFSIVDATADARYDELDEYDGYFKFPVLSSGDVVECGIVITDDAVQIYEDAGFFGEVDKDAVKLFAMFGRSRMVFDDDSVDLIID